MRTGRSLTRLLKKTWSVSDYSSKLFYVGDEYLRAEGFGFPGALEGGRGFSFGAAVMDGYEYGTNISELSSRFCAAGFAWGD